jgi:hypothetical protein
MGFVSCVSKSTDNLDRETGAPFVRHKFNAPDKPFNKATRLKEQLKFFGAKQKRFISVYAKKPRVRVKAKAENPRVYNKSPDAREAAFQAQLSGLYNQQMQLGIQNSSMGFNQMIGAQRAQFDYRPNSLIGDLSAMGMDNMSASNAAMHAQQCAANASRAQQDHINQFLFNEGML